MVTSTSVRNFAFLKDKIEDNLQRLVPLLGEFGFEGRIKAAQDRLSREQMHLLVVGEFSRGKSTFINALLGQPILPSKVNPTTATISVIEGGTEKKLQIQFSDGTYDEIDLPDEKVNKFLDQYVTTVNKQAHDIKQVRIQYPGFLKEWNCLIVDTPGVNDLDDLREEITFNYLSKADACIVLLDSQQPLSESERRFLKEKVLANDVQRLLFVINRMDEVEEMPNGEISKRLTNYVTRLLGEHLPMIESPKIFTLSSKESLRARFKRDENPWEKEFSHFEDELLAFLSQQAAKGRMPDHIERIHSIISDGISTIQERISLQDMTEEDYSKSLEKLYKESEQLQVKSQSLQVFLEKETTELSLWMIQFTRKEFTNLQQNLLEVAENCYSDEEILHLKSMITTGIRDIMEELLQKMNQFRRELRDKLQEKYGDLFQENRSLVKTNQSIMPLENNRFIDLVSFKDVKMLEDGIESVALNLAVGGTLGYIGAALFGPIGIAAAVAGTYLLGNKWEEGKRAKALEAQRVKIVSTIRGQIEQIIRNAEDEAQELAQKEVAPIGGHYRERMENRLETIRQTTELKQRELVSQSQNVVSERNRLEEKWSELSSMLALINSIKGEL
ncbi:dynamin family protein [Neobacillus sp. Marseille-QA0830]